MKNKLAINGGTPICKKLKPFNTIGKEELRIVTKVINSGTLSSFLVSILGFNHPFFGQSPLQGFYASVFFWKPLNLFRPYLNSDISATFCYQKKNGQQKYKANRSRQKYCHIPCSCTSSLTEIPLNYWT